LEKLASDGNEQLGADGDPDLSFYRVGAGSIKCLDTHMLLDPFEKQFDLPAKSVEVSYRKSWRREVVGQKNQEQVASGIEELYAPYRIGVSLGRIKGG